MVRSGDTETLPVNSRVLKSKVPVFYCYDYEEGTLNTLNLLFQTYSVNNVSTDYTSLS